MPRPSNWYLLGIAIIASVVQTFFGIVPAFAVGILLLFLFVDPPQIPKQYIYNILHPTSKAGEVNEKV